MARTKVQLPNGENVTIEHKEGASEQDVLSFAFNEYVINQDPGTTIGRSIAEGIDRLQQAYGSSLEGLGNVLDAESLQQLGGDIVAKNQGEIDARRFRERQLVDRDGLAGAFDYVAGLAGQSAPQMATTLAGAATGAGIGAFGGPLAPITVPVGAFVGGFLSNMPYFYGSNRERQKDAIEKGYKTEVSEGAAALAAIPQSSLDAIMGALGVKFIATPAMKIGGGIFTKASVGAGTGSIVEAPTEIGQAVLERAQAGLPLDDAEAIKEYVDAGVGGAILGGLFGGAGGAVSSGRSPEAYDEGEVEGVKEVEEDVAAKQVFEVEYRDEYTGEIQKETFEGDDAEGVRAEFEEGFGSGSNVPGLGIEILSVKPKITEVAIAPEEVTEPEVERDALEEESLRDMAVTILDEGATEEQIQQTVDELRQSMPREAAMDIEQESLVDVARTLAGPSATEQQIESIVGELQAEREATAAPDLEEQSLVDVARTLLGEDATQEQIDSVVSELRTETQARREPGVSAEALATYIPKRFVGEQAQAAPPFFQRFEPAQYDEGRFVDLETKQDLSDRTFEGGSIRIEGGRPVLETSDTQSDTIITKKASEEGALVRTNLFKQKAGWKWTKAPEGEPSTIVSVEQGSKHYYTLDFTSSKPLTLKTYPDKKSEPRGRPTTRGKVDLGQVVGEIEIRGKKHPVYDRVTVGEPDVVAGAAFTAPKKAELSQVQQEDIIDIDALINNVVENNIPVWFWYADQLGDGDINLPNQKGQSVKLDAGPSYALNPANKKAGRVWASGKSAKEINNKISQLRYTDKDGKDQTGYIFLVSGSPNKMFLFNKQAFRAFYNNAFGKTPFKKVKAEILSNKPTKAVRDALNKHDSLESLLGSADSRPFIEALVNQRGKRSPLARYLDSKGFFSLSEEGLRDGFYRENNFNLNDILLVVQPTKADNRSANHATYSTPVYGKVMGVPDKKVDAYLLIPDDVRKDKPITMEAPMAAQVVAPYGARVTEIKKVVSSEQAQRSVRRLRQIIEDNPEGFTVDTSGEFADGGFVVAPDKSTELVLDRSELSEELLVNYIVSNADKLNTEGAMIGGWFNSEEGQYVLDVVFAIDNLQDAVDIAIWANQDAIYDLDTNTEIPTKDDNKNPTTPQGDTRTASEILSKRPSEPLGQYSSQRRRGPSGVREEIPGETIRDVTAEAGVVLRPDERPVPGGFSSKAAMDNFIREEFNPIAKKLGIDIAPNLASTVARYNVTQKVIEYNPNQLFQQTQDYIKSAMREEIIHASMHKVLMNRNKSKSANKAWLDFFEQVGKDLTPEQRVAIEGVYSNLTDDAAYGAEYTRALIQQQLYGRFTEQDLKSGPAFEKIKQLIKSVQSYLAKALGTISEDQLQASAVIKESADLLRSLDPTVRPTNQSTIDAATRQVQKEQGILTAEAAVELNKPPKKKKRKGPVTFIEKYIHTADTVLRSIHPEIANLFQRYVHSVDKKKFDALKRTKPFIERYNRIKNKRDKQKLKQLLMYSPLAGGDKVSTDLIAERDALLRKYKLYALYKTNIKPVLYRLRADAVEQGIEMEYLQDYFPRRVIDYEGLRESFGRPIANDFRSYVDEINQRRAKRNADKGTNEPLVEYGSEEEALIFEKYIRNGDYVSRGVRTKKPRSANQRSIELIPLDKLDFYDDVGSALEAYISSMVHATETKRVFGQRLFKDGENIRLAGDMGPLLQDLISRGEIDEEAAFRTLPHFARMMLNSSNRENVFLGNMRQFSYLTTMVEFTSTLSQLFDLPFMLHRAGALNVASSLASPKYLKLADYGIDNDRISDEFRDEKNLLTQSVKTGLKASGFTRLDQLLKETSLNAQYKKLSQEARAYFRNPGSNKSKRFRTKVEAAVGRNEADATIAALRKGDRDNALVRDITIRESLEKTQPITKMQMPAGASANPNARIVYQMKSFMVTQLNYVRNEILNDMFSGDPRRATRGALELTRLMGFLLLVGMPVDALKDFIAGRLGYLSDYVFNGIFRVAGVSKYQVYQTKKEGIGGALLGYFTPITVQQLVDYTVEIQRVMSGDKALTESKLISMAPFSDVLNRMFGFTREQQKKKYIRKRREGERPFIVPPGAL